MPPAAGRNPLWPSIEHRGGNSSAVMVGGKVFRLIDSRSWDAGRRLEDMQSDDVDVQVVSPMPELLSHWFPADDADALSDHINRAIAKLCAAHPRSFVGIGMAPVQDPALAARRLAGIRALGLCGVEIGTHINGVALGDPRMHEFYAAAEEADLAIMIHPLHPSGLERMAGRPRRAAVDSSAAEACAQPRISAAGAVCAQSGRDGAGVLLRYHPLRPAGAAVPRRIRWPGSHRGRIGLSVFN